MSINFKKKSASLVPTPSDIHVQLFVDSDGLPKIKDNTGTVTSLSQSAVMVLTEQLASPSAESNKFKLYAKDVAGNTELFAIDSDGNEIRVTFDGNATAGALVGATGVVSVSSATAPTVGQTLTATSATTATWQTPAAGGPAGGGLGGNYPDPTVVALGTTGADVNVALAAPPSVGQTLIATSATTATWQTPAGPTGTAGGDLGGTYPNPTVERLGTTGAAVNIGLAAPPSTGQALIATSATTAVWSAQSVAISTGVSGLGAGIAAFLATPSSANLATAVSDETGSGALVLASSPTLVTPNLGTPSTLILTSATGRASSSQTADQIATTGTAVTISSTGPSTGQVLTATSTTGANWQTPAGGSSDPVSEFWAIPSTPHANDREFLVTPPGWSLFKVGTGLGTALGTLTSPTAGTPNFSVGLTTGQTRILANPTQKRSWVVWDSFVENQAWFYGYSITLGALQLFRARINTLNALSGPSAANGGMFQLCCVANSGGVPNFSTGSAFRMGWQPGSGTMPIVNGFHNAGSPGTNATSVDLADGLNSDCEFVLKTDSADGYAFTRTAGCTLSYGVLNGIVTLLGGAGATVWVGFLWNPVASIATGGRIFSADYIRQQDDNLFYG